MNWPRKQPLLEKTKQVTPVCPLVNDSFSLSLSCRKLFYNKNHENNLDFLYILWKVSQMLSSLLVRVLLARKAITFLFLNLTTVGSFLGQLNFMPNRAGFNHCSEMEVCHENLHSASKEIIKWVKESLQSDWLRSVDFFFTDQLFAPCKACMRIMRALGQPCIQ